MQEGPGLLIKYRQGVGCPLGEAGVGQHLIQLDAIQFRILFVADGHEVEEQFPISGFWRLFIDVIYKAIKKQLAFR
jgi:hypothetical protein